MLRKSLKVLSESHKQAIFIPKSGGHVQCPPIILPMSEHPPSHSMYGCYVTVLEYVWGHTYMSRGHAPMAPVTHQVDALPLKLQSIMPEALSSTQSQSSDAMNTQFEDSRFITDAIQSIQSGYLFKVHVTHTRCI